MLNKVLEQGDDLTKGTSCFYSLSILVRYASFQWVLFSFQVKFLSFEEPPITFSSLMTGKVTKITAIFHCMSIGNVPNWDMKHLLWYISRTQTCPLNMLWSAAPVPHCLVKLPLRNLLHDFSGVLPVNPNWIAQLQSALFLAMDRNISMWVAFPVKRVVKTLTIS